VEKIQNMAKVSKFRGIVSDLVMRLNKGKQKLSIS